jgi:hypothetical protein
MHSLKKAVVTPLLIFVLTVAACFMAAAGQAAAANSSNNTAATVRYCKKKLNKDSLCTTANMNRIRGAVADNCKNKTGNAKDDCIENAAENVIDQIAKKNPQNDKQFDNAVNAVTGGGGSQPPGQGGGGGSTCTGSSCQPTPTGSGKNCDSNQCDLVALYVNPFIQLLSIAVGLVVAGSLVMGGIQYMSSSGDPQKTGAAKTRITNTLLAFVAYAFLYAFLNFLIPGGLFR